MMNDEFLQNKKNERIYAFVTAPTKK